MQMRIRETKPFPRSLKMAHKKWASSGAGFGRNRASFGASIVSAIILVASLIAYFIDCPVALFDKIFFFLRPLCAVLKQVYFMSHVACWFEMLLGLFFRGRSDLIEEFLMRNPFLMRSVEESSKVIMTTNDRCSFIVLCIQTF